MTQDHYKTLGIRKGVSKKEVQQAYYRLAKKYHPDRNPNDREAEKNFREITKAYSAIQIEAKKYPNAFGKNVNYYKVLGVEINDSVEKITKAYHKLVKEYQADLDEGNKDAREALELINKAYEFLTQKDEQDPNDW